MAQRSGACAQSSRQPSELPPRCLSPWPGTSPRDPFMVRACSIHRTLAGIEQSARLTGDDNLLVGRYGPDLDARAVGGDPPFGHPFRVELGVERYAEPLQVAANFRPDPRRVLADAACEDDRICAPHLEQKGAQVVANGS